MNLHRVVTSTLQPWAIIIAMGCTYSAVAEPPQDTEIQIVESSVGGVTLKVEFRKNFPNNGVVEIGYSIVNSSYETLQFLYADSLADVEFRILGPDGHAVEPYDLPRGNYKRRFVSDIKPGTEAKGDPILVSNYWPLNSVGEYRCVLKKTIYHNDPSSNKEISVQLSGPKIEIESPEFRFLIESIDPAFQPPTARQSSKDGVLQTGSNSGEPITPGQNGIPFGTIAGVVGVCIVGALVLFKLRKKSHTHLES